MADIEAWAKRKAVCIITPTEWAFVPITYKPTKQSGRHYDICWTWFLFGSVIHLADLFELSDN